MYQYFAKVVRVVDADTIVVMIDVGFDLLCTQHVRVYGINAPEVSTQEGRAARDYVKKLLTAGTVVKLVTYKDGTEKYGRFLSEIFFNSKGTEISLGQLLIDSGYAVPFFGRKTVAYRGRFQW